ncbi:MAG: DegV family protein [Lachnospiraceae bacterium]|jgi:DegV family protein with EDD domain|nr:DegV family protein [uncultured Acetatifactor sp.]MCI9230876.1 DegV family protein [Lachnospiraceae bacterium]MCI9573441.1 DegV family protein [Lachnospiraceae bacterium]
MIRIITDSASDVVGNKREDLRVLPVSITFGEEEFQDGINLTHQMFYEKLIECDELPVTSQVPPFAFEKAFREAMETGNQVIAITLSSKLSGTWQSACIAAEGFGGKVRVVDSENASIGQHALVEYALRLKDAGLGIEEIVERLEADKKRIRLIALLDTLEYLKKGGRISKAAAMAGSLLSIKPVIAIQRGEVAILGKARGSKQGNNLLAEQIRQTGGIDFGKPFVLGYTGLSDAMLRKYIKDHESFWKSSVDALETSSVGGTIGTHIGPGAIGVAFFSAGDCI